MFMADSELNTTNTNHDIQVDNILSVHQTFKDLRINHEVDGIPLWLQNVESPFNWHPKRFYNVPSSEVIAKATQLLSMDEGFDSIFLFEKLVRMITVAFEYCNETEEAKASEQLKVCTQLLKKIEENKNNEQFPFPKLSEVLKHSLEATTAHILWRNREIEEAKKVAASIVPISCTTEAQAAVEGIRAQFYYHYRGQGASLAVEHARNALSLDPEEPLWQTLTAGAIRRHRKFCPGLEQVSDEEISLLERSVACLRSAKHLILLADSYRKHSDFTFKNHRSEVNFFQSQTFYNISDMQAKAFKLYKEALVLRPHSETVNRLCGYGLLKLPAFKSDYRLAERCLLRALDLSPNNPSAIHSLGLYYYKGLMDYEKAALFCEKAGKLGSFSASLDMLRMKRLIYENAYDPCFDFNKLLQLYGDNQTKRHEILCQMGSYYLFFERDLSKSLKYFKTLLIDEEAELNILTNHKCTFLNMACKINLLECIINEGTILLQAGEPHAKKKVDNCDLDEIKYFLGRLKKSHPHIFKSPVKADLIDSLHKVSDDIKQTYIRKKERRDSNKEKRKNSFNSRRRGSLDEESTFPTSFNNNYRRRSSGNIGDVPQYRLFRSSSSKSELGKDSSNNGNSVTTQETEKTQLNSKKRYDFYKTNGYHMDSSKYRRKSVSNLSDDVQKRLFRNQNNNDLKDPILEGISPNVTESITECSHEGKMLNGELDVGNRYQNSQLQQSINGKKQKQERRKTSWAEYSNRNVMSENWRKRDNDNI